MIWNSGHDERGAARQQPCLLHLRQAGNGKNNGGENKNV